ncbi:hypothetical protein Hdeb2414_s0005g00158671 [Helianthus debilis subsp. tardiflorus]
MGARKDMGKTFSKLTQEEVDSFWYQWGIDPSVNLMAPGCDNTVDQCPPGSIALYYRHFEFSNLRYPFFLHPHGVSRVLHFEVLCRALGYDPNLLMFRRFFSFETSQIDMVWRNPDVVLNELDPSKSELNEGMLKALRACPSRLRLFPEQLLVFTGVSVLWDKPNRDPSFIKGGQVMSALDFIKSDDTSNVVLGDTEVVDGEDAIIRTAEGSLVPGGKYDQGIEVEAKKELAVVTGKKGKSSGKKAMVSVFSEKSVEEPVEGNAEDVYVPNWQVKVGDNFKSSTVCEDVLNHFSPPSVRSSNSAMQDDVLISRMLLGVCNLAAILPEGVSCFRKRTHEFEEFSKKRGKTKASIVAMKKEIEGFAEKEKSWVVKVHELTKRHEIELSNEKKRMEADRLQLQADSKAFNVQQKAFLDEKEGLKASLSQATSDNQWLIEHGYQQVVTYLLHSTEFNSALGDVYTKLLNQGKHLGFVAGYKAHESGQPQEQSSFYQPQASTIFKEVVLKMERLTYPYVGEVST